MTVERYEELKQKYSCGPIYNNSSELREIGFYVDCGKAIPELENEFENRTGVIPLGHPKFRAYHVYYPLED